MQSRRRGQKSIIQKVKSGGQSYISMYKYSPQKALYFIISLSNKGIFTGWASSLHWVGKLNGWVGNCPPSYNLILGTGLWRYGGLWGMAVGGLR